MYLYVLHFRQGGVCTNIQDPPAETYLKELSATSVKEYQYAEYQCPSDGTFANGESVFRVQCPKGLDGFSPKFPEASEIEWPTCQVSSCKKLPSISNFAKVSTAPISVGDYALYKCVSTGWVTDDGEQYKLRCNEDGSFDTNVDWKTCRPRTDCDDDPPIPSETTHLSPSASTDLKEFESAVYECEDTFTLEGVDFENVENNQFKVQCGLGGNFSNSVNWPNCLATICLQSDIPTFEGFKTTTTADVKVGLYAYYACETDGQVTGYPNGMWSLCQNTGEFWNSNWYEGFTCRDAVQCEDPPEPDPAQNVKPSSSTDLKEGDKAVYECKDGLAAFGGKTKFEFSCENDKADGKWSEDDIASMYCYTDKCKTLPTIEGFKAVSQAPIDMGKIATYECSEEGHVHDEGKKLEITCLTDGTFKLPETVPTCRAPVDCEPAPAPPSDTNLETATSSASKEWDFATYPCKSGYALTDGKTKYELTCKKDGKYDGDTPESWSTCHPKCTTHLTTGTPTPDGTNLVPVDASPDVFATSTTAWKCDNSNYVTNVGKTAPIKCGTDGNFIDTLDTIECVPIVTCDEPHTPELNKEVAETLDITVIAIESTGPYKSWDSAIYACQDGYSIIPGTGDVNMGVETDDGKFKVTCNHEGKWPEGRKADEDFPYCMKDPARKKRFIEHEGLRPDITYTINVYFETQWMYADTVEEDILVEKNFSWGHPMFPQSIVDVFHERIETVLGDPDMGALQLNYPVFPACEQPMLPRGFIGSCVESSSMSFASNTSSFSTITSFSYLQ